MESIWYDSGLGEFLAFAVIIGGCVVHGLLAGKIYFDTQEWEFKMKNSPAGTGEQHLKNLPTLIISNSECKRKVGE